MKEKLAEKFVEGLDRGFSFDIGNVSADVARYYFDLKRFQMIISYIFQGVMACVILGTIIALSVMYIRSIRRNSLAKREEALEEIANQREVFRKHMAREVRKAAKKETDELRKDVQRTTDAAFEQLTQYNKKVLEEKHKEK